MIVRITRPVYYRHHAVSLLDVRCAMVIWSLENQFNEKEYYNMEALKI